MGDRPYYEYYYQRDEDNLVRSSLTDQTNVLISGPPLSGKTRAVYQALKNVKKRYDVLIPRFCDINLETFIFPRHFKFWRKWVIFIDDLHRFVELKNFEHLFKVAKEKSVTMVATCRSGMEYDKAKNKMIEKGMDIEKVFSQKVELGIITEEVGEEIAGNVGIKWAEVKFNGTVGSIFMPLLEMEKRFGEIEHTEKTILRGIRNLYLCGVYEERQVFPLKWIKMVAQKSGLKGEDYKWTGWLEDLKAKEFLTFEKDKVKIEEVYLEYIVEPAGEKSPLELFAEMLPVFSREPEALFRLGNRAYDFGINELEKALFMKIAIKAFEESLKVRTLELFPMDYAMTQNNLGNAYRTLSKVEGKAENCRKAIKAFEESLKVRTLEHFPIQYATTQNNLGIAYGTLSEVEGKAENIKKAIKVFEESLRVYILVHFQIQHAATQNNLGNAYGILAGAENKAENCKKAKKASEEALKIFTEKEFPEVYPRVLNNLRILLDFCKEK